MSQDVPQSRRDSAKFIRIAILVIYDVIAIFAATVMSIWTRFDFNLKVKKECHI